MSKLRALSSMLQGFDAITQTAENSILNLDTSSETASDLERNLDAFKALVQSVSAQAPVMESKNTDCIVVSAFELLESCDALILNKSAMDIFRDSYTTWKKSSSDILYLETISASNICSKEEEPLAITLLEQLLNSKPPLRLRAMAMFILSRKLSFKQPHRSYMLGMEAFELDHTLFANITNKESNAHHLVYQNVKDTYFDVCPICLSGVGIPYYCALPFLLVNYSVQFNPIKLWMKCASCGQLYAHNFPQRLTSPQPETEELGDAIYLVPKFYNLSGFGAVLKNLLAYANGNRLLEVGAGSGELIAAALELGCEVEAVEISRKQAVRLTELLDIPVHCMDFLQFDTGHKFNIITMGDVIEHITAPAAALKKAHALLEDGGILWISTPNFESGYSRLMKFNDPMWNEPYHITYFSYRGFKRLLLDNGFCITDYSISSRYNGSMEIVAKKI